jgi:hypothetical protein
MRIVALQHTVPCQIRYRAGGDHDEDPYCACWCHDDEVPDEVHAALAGSMDALLDRLPGAVDALEEVLACDHEWLLRPESDTYVCVWCDAVT